jgi:hypothetical protein
MAITITVACPGCDQHSRISQGWRGPDPSARCPRCQEFLARDGARIPCGHCGRFSLVRRHWYGLDRTAVCTVCGTHLTGTAAIRDVLGAEALRSEPPACPVAVSRGTPPAWETDPIGWAADAGLLDDDADHDGEE